jgi:hypothetical protein
MFADLLLQEVILSTLVPDLTYKLRTENLPERHVGDCGHPIQQFGCST